MRQFRLIIFLFVGMVSIMFIVPGSYAGENTRPPFDKSAYKKTVWSQANPWFLPNRSRTHASGGPDFAWHQYPRDAVATWKKTAEVCKPYGLTGIQMEILINKQGIGYLPVWRQALEGFKQADNGFQASFMLTIHKLTKEELSKQLIKLFDDFSPLWKEHPNFYRLNGMPVNVLYTYGDLSPQDLGEVINAVEKKHGRMIWLLNSLNTNKKKLREYLPVVDGITQYANWGEEGQRIQTETFKEIMHNEFPEKIFELSTHNTYTVHFHYGGTEPNGTLKFRNSWSIVLDANPDSVVLTNFFDCYENSRMLPSYEMEDIFMRISQHHIEKWRGDEVSATDWPDLYVCSPISVIIGQKLRIEVIGFPVNTKDKKFKVGLELCDAKGEVIHSFPQRTMTLDDMATEAFEIGSEKLYAQRAVYPRIYFMWKNRRIQSELNPQINLVTSLRPHLLSWCRSLKNTIRMQGSRTWQLNGKTNGDTAFYSNDGMGYISSTATSQRNNSDDRQGGGGTLRILRNGREIDSFDFWDLNISRFIRTPDPAYALDWYNIELENPRGCRYMSPAIWMTSGRRKGKVEIPFLLDSGQILPLEVEKVRVPFFLYKFERDYGMLLFDSSGYEHHGYLGGEGYPGGSGTHLLRTGYRHEHTGSARPPKAGRSQPKFHYDSKNKGYLEFTGKEFAMIQGGTAFPYASTYEVIVQPEKSDKRQMIFGAAGVQVAVAIEADGTLSVYKSYIIEDPAGLKPKVRKTATFTSTKKISTDTWTHIAIVYDLKKLELYINGQLDGSCKVPPNKTYEKINSFVLGGNCGFPFNPKPSFKGKIKMLRIYGRNLKTNEFLRL